MPATLKAVHVAASALPIIDISGLSSADPADRRGVAQELRRACLDKGFFYVKNHGIPETLVAQVFAEAETFFALPAADKLALDKAHSKANRGYEPLKAQTLEAGAPPDLKEGFYIGPEHAADDPRVLAGKFNHGPNQWPANAGPGFHDTMTDYFTALLGLGERLMRGIALSLDLDEDYFKDFCADPMATLRLLHYPPQQPGDAPEQRGAGAHTDFGGLTLLRQDNVGGLQVWDQESQGWVHAEPVPGTYIVNLGDMIARWTNDLYRSTLHRVINTSGRERYSVPFFYVGNYDHEVACIPTCLAAGEAPKYPPTTVEAHLRTMYARTYAPAT
ncbi:isopenicillin N synthase family dioxygenase [Rhodopseudomonas sp. P2A-2r]|uniref:isopenicillin N synthase family dioxygenase n=1 Tax=unclassified Rhodopseudomonas TaxID=2638247 RepID=UPI00223489E0|nr:2-oxoglutarate and iron-dependent oxygenase domain-containing protein [Rhodopseudomonas sp. P2A-2r]UZE49248.1 isopenicillin N synthase family oxygenase [Rhodopseudomonas sp. P2A-2r]